MSSRPQTLAKDTVSTLSGTDTGGFADGAAAEAQFSGPMGVAIDGEGGIVIVDNGNDRIRRLSPDGKSVSTLAGSVTGGYADGAAAEAKFDCPYGVAIDGEGGIVIADKSNNRIRYISQ